MRLALAFLQDRVRKTTNSWGAVMQKRFRAFLLGTSDAMPQDYVYALVATVGLMAAIFAGML